MNLERFGHIMSKKWLRVNKVLNLVLFSVIVVKCLETCIRAHQGQLLLDQNIQREQVIQRREPVLLATVQEKRQQQGRQVIILNDPQVEENLHL